LIDHHGVAEAWIDVIFGTFDEDNEDDKRVTFGRWPDRSHALRR